tara:strand:- start:290 stop:790 length:501 start_codon:yes stop_codon:yes gene_type:complete
MIICSLCGSQGVNKKTCPMNPYSKCPNYDKHVCIKKDKKFIKGDKNCDNDKKYVDSQTYNQNKLLSQNKLRKKYNLSKTEFKEVLRYASSNNKSIKSWCEDLDYLKLNYSLFSASILLRVLKLSKNKLNIKLIFRNVDFYNKNIIQKYRYLSEDILYRGLMKNDGA